MRAKIEMSLCVSCMEIAIAWPGTPAQFDSKPSTLIHLASPSSPQAPSPYSHSASAVSLARWGPPKPNGLQHWQLPPWYHRDNSGRAWPRRSEWRFFFHQNCLGHRGCLEKRYVKKPESSIPRLVPSWTKRSTSTAYRQTFHQLNKKQILSHPLTCRMSSSDPVALQAKKSSESIRLPCQLAPTSWRRRYRYHFLSLWNSIYPLLRLDFCFPWKNSTSDPAASMITSTYGSMIKACLEHQG